MTAKEALKRARELLAAKHIQDVILESEILLRHTLNSNRAQFYQDLDRELTAEQEQAFRRLIDRYVTGEPIAYITGRREFYRLDFKVNPYVLVPRPETELLVEKTLEFARQHHIRTIADVGTGCGAIAVSIAINLPQSVLYAVDISADALEVARENCEKHEVAGRIRLLRGNLLEPLPQAVDLITANLPYVKTSEIPDKGPVSFEPVTALDGGEDGLDVIRRFCPQIKSKLRPGGCVLMEIGLGQAEAVQELLRGEFPAAHSDVFRDLAGIERVVSLRLTA